MRMRTFVLSVMSATLIGAGALVLDGVAPRSSLAPFSSAAAAPDRYTVQDAWPGVTFAVPVAVAAPRDGTDRVFVVERAGKIMVGRKFRGAGAVPAPTVFLDISSLQMPADQLDQGHGGLVNLAFAADFATSKEFYVFYGTGTGQPNDAYRSIVASYKVSAANPDVADPASVRILLQIPKKNPIHFGGGMAMAADGTLYIGIGDSGMHNDPEKLGQDTRTLEAKILRIDPRQGPAGQPYGIPRDNPWADGRGGVKAEIFAYGVRNPYRLSVDAGGLCWFGDLGQKQREEVSVAKRGGNMGWPMMEADVPLAPGAKPTDYVAPVFAYGRDLGRCVIGGLVYRGQRCAALRGKYLFGDNATEWTTDENKTGRVWALPVAGDRTTGAPEVVADVEDIVSIDEDAQGEVYFSMLATGRVTTLVPAP